MIIHIFWGCMILFMVPVTFLDVMERWAVAGFWVCISLGILATSNIESLVDRWYDQDGKSPASRTCEEQKEFCRRLNEKVTVQMKAADQTQESLDAFVEELFKLEDRNVHV